ncbi:unnamed protein product [Amoebophrya sp. A25]|nr:unnamed protein product [Amoebophrya sp. A25]|eukprot:GSA25T00025867001.1
MARQSSVQVVSNSSARRSFLQDREQELSAGVDLKKLKGSSPVYRAWTVSAAVTELGFRVREDGLITKVYPDSWAADVAKLEVDDQVTHIGDSRYNCFAEGLYRNLLLSEEVEEEAKNGVVGSDQKRTEEDEASSSSSTSGNRIEDYDDAVERLRCSDRPLSLSFRRVLRRGEEFDVQILRADLVGAEKSNKKLGVKLCLDTIIEVEANSISATVLGLLPGDRITHINGDPVDIIGEKEEEEFKGALCGGKGLASTLKKATKQLRNSLSSSPTAAASATSTTGAASTTSEDATTSSSLLAKRGKVIAIGIHRAPTHDAALALVSLRLFEKKAEHLHRDLAEERRQILLEHGITQKSGFSITEEEHQEQLALEAEIIHHLEESAQHQHDLENNSSAAAVLQVEGRGSTSTGGVITFASSATLGEMNASVAAAPAAAPTAVASPTPSTSAQPVGGRKSLGPAPSSPSNKGSPRMTFKEESWPTDDTIPRSAQGEPSIHFTKNAGRTFQLQTDLAFVREAPAEDEQKAMAGLKHEDEAWPEDDQIQRQVSPSSMQLNVLNNSTTSSSTTLNKQQQCFASFRPTSSEKMHHLPTVVEAGSGSESEETTPVGAGATTGVQQGPKVLFYTEEQQGAAMARANFNDVLDMARQGSWTEQEEPQPQPKVLASDPFLRDDGLVRLAKRQIGNPKKLHSEKQKEDAVDWASLDEETRKELIFAQFLASEQRMMDRALQRGHTRSWIDEHQLQAHAVTEKEPKLVRLVERKGEAAGEEKEEAGWCPPAATPETTSCFARIAQSICGGSRREGETGDRSQPSQAWFNQTSEEGAARGSGSSSSAGGLLVAPGAAASSASSLSLTTMEKQPSSPEQPFGEGVGLNLNLNDLADKVTVDKDNTFISPSSASNIRLNEHKQLLRSPVSPRLSLDRMVSPRLFFDQNSSKHPEYHLHQDRVVTPRLVLNHVQHGLAPHLVGPHPLVEVPPSPTGSFVPDLEDMKKQNMKNLSSQQQYSASSTASASSSGTTSTTGLNATSSEASLLQKQGSGDSVLTFLSGLIFGEPVCPAATTTGADTSTGVDTKIAPGGVDTIAPGVDTIAPLVSGGSSGRGGGQQRMIAPSPRQTPRLPRTSGGNSRLSGGNKGLLSGSNSLNLVRKNDSSMKGASASSPSKFRSPRGGAGAVMPSVVGGAAALASPQSPRNSKMSFTPRNYFKNYSGRTSTLGANVSSVSRPPSSPGLLQRSHKDWEVEMHMMLGHTTFPSGKPVLVVDRILSIFLQHRRHRMIFLPACNKINHHELLIPVVLTNKIFPFQKSSHHSINSRPTESCCLRSAKTALRCALSMTRDQAPTSSAIIYHNNPALRLYSSVSLRLPVRLFSVLLVLQQAKLVEWEQFRK